MSTRHDGGTTCVLRNGSTRRGLAAAPLLALLAACGGVSSGPPPAPDDERRVSFHGVTTTVLRTGEIGFTLTPPLDQAERAVCALQEIVVESCLHTAERGAIPFRELEPGIHRFVVEVRRGGELTDRAEHALTIVSPDVVVFGATPGGILAAIAAAQHGHVSAIIEPTRWVGGMLSAGLAKTDVGRRGAEIIGGLTAEFFARVRARMQMAGTCLPSECRSGFDVTPGVAEQVLEEMLRETGVIVERSAALLGVEKTGAMVTDLLTSRGTVAADVFIDASYEGDLIALAGISYRIGREPRVIADPPDDPTLLAEQEDDAGVLRYRLPRGLYADPYVVPGDPSSGTLPFIEPLSSKIPRVGSGDTRVMAYTYRLCVTDDPTNRVPFTPPADYVPWRYEAAARVAVALTETGANLAEVMFNPAPVALSTNRAFYKYDLNGGSTFSIDMTAPDMNQAYVSGTETERARIREAYRSYIQGLLYFWQTDPRFGALNGKVARFGYCKDEFADRGGWPHQLYVRTGRRMVGEYVMNQNDVMQNGRRPPIRDVVGFGAYDIDIHTFRYLAAPVIWPDGTRRAAIAREGFLIRRLPDHAPYPISYRALVPKATEATNVLSPVPLSATHVAYASLRMEPTFMILGESAGVAAAIAVETRQPVQAIDYEMLRRRLLARGQRLPR